MPRIKRWYPVSHDLNGDPEVWDLTKQFGDRSLRIWLEILSISDRSGGYLPPMSEAFATTLAGRCQVVASTVKKVWQLAHNYAWMVSDPIPRVVKYGDYHKTREPNETPRREPIGSLPSEPSEPILPNRIKNKSQPSFEGIKAAQTLSDKISQNFPQRTMPTEAVLSSWALEADRINRIDLHPWPEIKSLLEWSQADSFWKSNILSMSKFRKQWTQLLAKQAQGESNERTARKGSQGLDTLKAWGDRSKIHEPG